MTSPDQLPEDEPEQTYTVRVNRDTLILIAALGFLGIAVLLALLFPPSSANVATVSSPTLNTSGRSTSIPSVPNRISQTSTSMSISATITPTTISTSISTSLPEPGAPTSQAYPGPGNNVQATQARPTGLVVPTIALADTPRAGQPTFGPTIIASVPTATFLPAATISRQTSVAVQPIATSTPRLINPPIASSTPLPTTQAAPTNLPVANATLQPSSLPHPTALPQSTTLPDPTQVPAPELPKALILRGNTTWSKNNSPIKIDRDLVVGAGATLQIEPGVDIFLAPGVSLSNQGTIRALGQADQPVRFFASSNQRWEGIFGRDNSDLVLEHTEVRGGGAGGTVIGVESTGTVRLQTVRITDNGGHVAIAAERVDIRDSEISGNDMPYGAALEANFATGGSVTLLNSRIWGNRLSFGSPQVLVRNSSGFNAVNVDIQRNLLIGQDGPNLTLSAATKPFNGNIVCNALLNGANGLSIRSDTLQVPGFPLNIRDNAIDDHVPPIVPIYLTYGIGRGATSEVELDMRNNWWGSDIGPYEPDRHADGRGDSVGENIAFDPWLREWPTCAPHP